MNPFILALQIEMPRWGEIVQFGPTVVLLALILWSLIRLAPTWKEVRLKELDLRGDENVVKREQAGALTSLANALTGIAVEQRRATEEVSILQRVNADSSDVLSQNVRNLSIRLDDMQRRLDDKAALQATQATTSEPRRAGAYLTAGEQAEKR